MKSQLACAAVIQHRRIRNDIAHSAELFGNTASAIPMHAIVLGKGYDAEWAHRMIRKENTVPVIPVRGTNNLSTTRGRYRKMVRREPDESTYHQRNKTETVFSVIKRRLGSEIKSYDESMREKELLYRVLACNCHRMCVTGLVWLMISRKPKEEIMSSYM